MPAKHCRGDVPALLLAVVSRTLLLTALLLLLWTTVLAAVGAHVTTVVSGSMSPRILPGDVVAAFAVPTESLTPGRVLLVDDPDHEHHLRLHRLVREEPGGLLRLQGDANPSPDRTAVAPEAVRGVAMVRVPWVGLPQVWLREGNALALGLTAAALILLLRLATADRDIVSGRPCRRCGTPRWQLTTRVQPERRSMLPAAALFTATALLATVPAGATWSSTTETSSALGTPSFPCFSKVQDDPVLAWDFAEKRGTAVRDSSGHGNDGQMTGVVTRLDGSCETNPYAQFGSSTSSEGWAYADAPTTAPTRFAIEVWFRTTNQDGGRLLGFGSDQAASSSFRDRHLYLGNDGLLRFGVEESGSQFKFTLAAPQKVTDGAWHHAVGVFESGRMELWLDGEMAGRRTDARSLRAYDGFWRVGRQALAGWPAPGSYGYTGDADTARVFAEPLTADQVRAHFAAGR